VHVAKIQGNNPAKIGSNVTIGANAVVHACTIHDNVLIGIGAQVVTW
jgi:carbonic anhydrase/acetyltransferase-like protein (isoleucine patch superfamily)